MEQTEKDVLILAIETSCDETAAAVVKNGREILSNIIYTQIKLHTVFGGVVPEIASRKHIEKINPVIEAALLAPVEHALQGAQGVKAARKAGVGVELREGFLDLAYGESGVETALDGGRQTLNVALSLEA